MTFRTHYCRSIDKNNIGQEVAIAGWIHRRRDHGGVIFFDIRDETGLFRLFIIQTIKIHSAWQRLADLNLFYYPRVR